MTHTNPKRYRSYNNSEMMALDNLMAQPALNYQAPKYKILLDDLQAGILKHQNKNNSIYLFIQFNEQRIAKKWIAGFAQTITTAKEQLDKQPDQVITFSLTNAGYDFLDLPKSIKPNDEAFLADMNKRVTFGENKINTDFSNTPNIHAIIMIASDNELTEKNLEDEIELKKEIIADIVNDKENALKILFQQIGSKQNVPFGKSTFKDGFTNPKYFPAATSSGKHTAIKHEGLPPLSLALTIDKGGNTDAPCGSLGAFARFEFNQTAINKLTGQIKKVTVNDDDLAEANLIGRFHDGTPLTLSDKPIGNPSDDFDFHEMIKSIDTDQLQSDADASRCPYFAHARKSNPRTKDSKNRKILRRGVYYNESDKKQGLLFVAYQQSLENQFEYIVKSWMMNPLIETDQEYLTSDFKEDYDKKTDYEATEKKESHRKIYKRSGIDILFAPKGTVYDIPKEWNLNGNSKGRIEIERQLVDFEGGVYFFTPSISFLKKIELFPTYDDNSGKVFYSKQIGINQPAFNIIEDQVVQKATFRPGTVMHITPESEIEVVKNNEQESDIPYIKRDKQNFKYQLKKESVSTEPIKT